MLANVRTQRTRREAFITAALPPARSQPARNLHTHTQKQIYECGGGGEPGAGCITAPCRKLAAFALSVCDLWRPEALMPWSAVPAEFDSHALLRLR